MAALVGLAGLLLFASGCSWMPKEELALKPPLVKPQQESYNLAEVKRGTVTKLIKGTARFESSDIVYQAFQGAAGKIAAVSVKTGDVVRKGAPLVELDIGGLDIAVKERVRDLEVAKLSLREAQESRDEQRIRIRLLELDIAQQKLNEAERQLAGRKMTAEIDGVITAMEPLKPGDVVESGKVYVTIADPANIQLIYTSSASGNLQEVQVGMKAEVLYKNRSLEAVVVQSPSSAPVTSNKQLNDKYAKTIYFRLADSSVRPALNESAEIAIVLQQKDHVLYIPKFGVSTLLGRQFVKVLDGESIQEIDVETGIETLTDIEIVKGLEEGQRVILP